MDIVKPKNNNNEDVAIDSNYIAHNGKILCNALGVTLYNGNGSNGTITLSDNISNYTYLEIFYYYVNSNRISSVKAVTDSGRVLISNAYLSSTNVFVASSAYTLSENTLTPYLANCNEYNVKTSAYSSTETCQTYITKVIGY